MNRLNSALLLTTACLLLLPLSARGELIWHSAMDGNANAIVGSNGVATGNPTGTLDKNGNLNGAVDFSGGNFFYTIAANPAVSSLSAGSISAWVKWDDSAEQQGVVAVGETGGGTTQYFSFMRDDVASLRADLDDGVTRQDANDDSGTLVTGDWYHVVTTFTANDTLRLYINGVVQTDTGDLSTANAQYTGLDTWLVGTERQDSRFFNGAIDDVRIYDMELSAGEVGIIYETGPLYMIPEPSSLTIAVLGVLGLALCGWRREL